MADEIPPGGMFPTVPITTSTVKPEHAPPTETGGMFPSTNLAEHKPLENAPDESFLKGTAKNAATGAIKGLSWIPGWVGDLQGLADLGHAGIRAQFGDKSTTQELEGLQSRRAAREKEIGSVRLAPPTSEEIAKPVLERTGAYTPETDLGRVGQMGVAGAIAALTPGGWRKMAEHALTGAGTAATAEEVGHHLGPGAAIAAAMMVPRITRYAHEKLGTPEAAKKQAGKMLLDTTADPNAAANANITSEVPGYKPTLAQTTGDVKHAQAEGTAEKTDRGFQAKIRAQREGQNEAQSNLVNSLADPKADPTVISRAVQKHADDLTAAHDANVTALQTEAQTKLQNAPQGANVEDLSRDIQQRAYDSGTKLRKDLGRVADTIDPEGKLNIVTTPLKQHAEEILPAVREQVEKNAAAPYLEKASGYGDVMPFSKIWDFDQELTGAISKAARAGDTNALNELRALKGKVKETINGAIDNQHAWDAAAVARGELDPERTLAARLQREQAAWYEARRSGQGSATGTGPDVAAGPGRVSGPSRDQGTQGPGPGRAAGDQGNARPNMQEDPGTAQRLALFNRAYGIYKDRYRSGPVGTATKQKPFGGDFVDPLQAAKTLFVSGDKGAVNVGQWLAADSSPQAVANLKTMAATRLRESLGEAETLTPDKLQAWKGKYANALRAVDEVSPGFSSSFDNAAAAHTAMADAAGMRDAALKANSKSAAAKFMGLDNAEDVTNQVASMMNAKDGARQIKTLKNTLVNSGHPEAFEGVRRAAVDWITNNLTLAVKDSHGEPVLSSHKVDTFIRNNPDTLKHLFGEQGVDVLNKLQHEIARAQRSTGFKRDTTGSDTATYLAPFYAKMAQAQAGAGVGHSMDTLALMEGIEHGPQAAVPFIGARVGLGFLKSMASKLQARGAQNVMDVYHQALLDPKFGQDLLRKAIVDKQGRRWSVLQVLQDPRMLGIAGETTAESQRQGHARGGAVLSDHAAHASRAIRQVDTIRRQFAEASKPLLNIHDSAIASALESARRAAG